MKVSNMASWWLCFVALLAFVHAVSALPAYHDGHIRSSDVESKELLEDLVSMDKNAAGLNSGKALEPNSDYVREHEFDFLTPDEVSFVANFLTQLTRMVVRRITGPFQLKKSMNLQSELAKALAEEPEGADDLDHPHDDFLGYHDPDFEADEKSEGHVRNKRSVFTEDEVMDDGASEAQNDLQLHFPDSKPSTYPKRIKLPTGVAVSVQPGQTIHIGANGEIITAPSSSSAEVKGHEAPYGGGEGVSITMTDQTSPKFDKNTLPTAPRPGHSGPIESVPINPKVSGLVALLQKTVADGHFRHPMDKDMPIEQIQVKLRNGTRYFYSMSRDVTGVEHTFKGSSMRMSGFSHKHQSSTVLITTPIAASNSGDCDPESDPTCESPLGNGRDAGNIHVHLSNGSTINYSFKKSNQLDPISLDAKERALKIKLYVTAATTLDDILFRKPGSDEILKDRLHFEEKFLEELGKKLRDASLLIPKDEENPSGIVGNENSMPGQPTMEGGTGATLNSAVEHYMGLLSSEETRNHGTVGAPVISHKNAGGYDLGAAAGWALGGTAGIVMFMAVMFMGAHWIESCDQKAGRLPTC